MSPYFLSLPCLLWYGGNLLPLDALTVVRNSILCGDFAIKLIDEPFVADADDKDEWSL